MRGRKKERQEGRKKREGESGRKQAEAVKTDIEEVEIKGMGGGSDYGNSSQDKERGDEKGSEERE